MKTTLVRMALAAAALRLAGPAAAQQLAQAASPAPATVTSSGSPARLLRAASAAGVKVDGRLDEAVWATATPATDFVQQQPNDGRPASERTEARVLFDGEAIYWGCGCTTRIRTRSWPSSPAATRAPHRTARGCSSTATTTSARPSCSG